MHAMTYKEKLLAQLKQVTTTLAKNRVAQALPS
jgi:hypothetical protein